MKLRAGSLLLAEPYLLDPNFKRTAIVLADHHEEGTVGFVLNRKLDWRINEVINGFPDFDDFLYYGGPVQRDTLHFMHTLGSDIADAIHVAGDMYWGGSFEQMTYAVMGGTATPDNTKFFLGYSGWSPGQLEGEVGEGTWVVSDALKRFVFDTPADQVWSRAMRRLGNTYGVIGDMDEEMLN